MKAQVHTKWLLTAATSAMIVALGIAPGEANAATKTKRAANALVNVLPITNAQKAAMKANIQIYDRLGCEAGRYLSVRKHGIAGDPGKCKQ